MLQNKWMKLTMMLAGLLCAIVLIVPALAGSSEGQLKPVFIEVDSPAMVKKLARMGIDIAAVRKQKDGKGDSDSPLRVEAVISPLDENKLNAAGISWREAIVQKTASQLKVQKDQQTTDSVYHSFDEPELGIKARIYKVAEEYKNIVKLETIGESLQGRPILALCLSKKKKGKTEKIWNNAKPEVLILATHHAREWVATQMAIRLVDYLTVNYGKDPRITKLLNTTKLWIIPVANPDGYEYTFTNERLWRKNLRDNDEDGEITLVDGVDLNRNFSSRWGLDNEGSSSIWSDATYRGPAPNSEPETKVVVKFMKRHKFKFLISYHTYSNLILYPWGWQVKTPSFDDPIFVAQAGTDENSAIFDSLLNEGYNPGVGADLYATNGDFTDWAYGKMRIPSYTVELTNGYHDPEDDSTFYGFEFPDDETMVQQVFEDNLEFALSLTESAQDPAHPVSPVGIETDDIYHTPLTKSWGRRQAVEVLARTGKNPPKLFYQVNNGRWQKGYFHKMLGEFYNDQPGRFYCGYRAFVPRQKTGDEVKYYIRKNKTKLGPYTYTVENGSSSKVLVVSAEDYTGEYPDYTDQSGPNYLSFYTDALDTGGYSYDVWDVTAEESAPDYTQVLSNYDVAIWYTGDDYAPTVPGLDVHEDMTLAMRKFLNFGGKILASGQGLSAPSTVYENYNDDFFQYHFGAFIHVDEGGMDVDQDPAVPFEVTGESGDPIFDGLSFTLSGDDGANNQTSADSFLATSYFHPNNNNTIAARYQRPGGPYSPHSGDYYVYSQMADMAFKRFGGVFDLPATAQKLSFWASIDTEKDWDYAFVEIRPVGTDNWTTLPDINGLTTSTTGESCISGWVEQIHPQLAHYMNANCDPTGTTGEWHAFSGSSSGWKQVQMDLSSYAGQQVELYISYASDWGNQNLGVFLDDVEVDGYPLEDFEGGLGDWQVGSTEGNFPFNNWTRIEGVGFPEGPVIRTDDTVYMGFGFEAINDADTRAVLMERVMDYFME